MHPENRTIVELRTKYIRFAAVAALVVLLDQVSKTMVLKMIPLFKSVVVIPGILF